MASNSKKIGWGILSTGHIARVFARGVTASRTGRLAAVASRDLRKASAFAAEFDVKNAYGSYIGMLKDPTVDAVYVATPHPFHARWTVAAARAGKHVLCEKPMAMTASEAGTMVREARKRRIFLMEAFMYRCHPQTERAVRLVREGAIGDVRLIESSFCYNAAYDPKSRLFNKALGGGAILDIGLYPVSFARLMAGAAAGKPFLDPIEVRGSGHVGRTGVDEWAAAVLRFPGGVIAEVSCGTRVHVRREAKVFGTEGVLTLPEPWKPDSRILLHKAGEPRPREIKVPGKRGVYSCEADKVGDALRQRKLQSGAMTWADTLGNMRVLDRWRRCLK